MKQIIVPTDFSPAAERAILYAAQLAKSTNSSLLIVNLYEIPVSMGDLPVMIISAEELKKNADTALNDLKTSLEKTEPDVTVETKSIMGDVADEVNELSKNPDALAVVVGTKNHKGLEKVLLGNTALSIVKHCACPAISVPVNASVEMPKNVVLATDLENVEDIPVQKICEIVDLLQTKLHVVHVSEQDERNTTSKEVLLQRLQQVNPIFHTVSDNDVIHGLQQYVETENIDMLIALPHKHSIYEKLFFKLHTDGIIEKIPIPVMCL